MNKELEKEYIKYIPRNVMDNSDYLGFKVRNTIEALAVLGIGLLIKMPLKLNTIGLGIFIAVVGALALFAFIGIHGVSLTQYLTYIIRFNRRKRKLSEPDVAYDKKRDRERLRKGL